ncbi:hypothetical protein GOP47_0005266 [Adiantum capillus-veneris]|uniref:GH16 domain-containing protein n=1 Tax=Adiantum capillus-veneris TaxID=13818 RepID=A0A9D4V5I4_ADICA|nr:hypothetical protein GOP47_0005266 [Adiantum capillus-veneris]
MRGITLGVCVVVAILALQVVEVVRAQTKPKPPPPQPSNFSTDVEVTWGADRVQILDGGQQLQLSLDCYSGEVTIFHYFASSGFKSKKEYLFANVDMQIKLVPGDSAGTVAAYYLSSQTPYHDELDFEFLGNESGQPYTLQTNVFVNGVGGREQRMYLWFDPTADFHTYQIFWTPRLAVFFVDGTPIRVFNKTSGQPYLDQQAMGVYSSIWNGGDWATKGGSVNINWANAPFNASYRNFQVKPAPIPPPIDYDKLSSVKSNFITYNYCSDRAQYPSVPVDCL